MAPEPAVPAPRLALVFESDNAFTVSMARGLLQDAEIAFWIDSEERAARLGITPLSHTSSRFLVAQADEAAARELLAQLESPVPDESSS